MRLETLKLQNFRGFEQFELALDPQCNVLIGNNGSGKSALLDALVIAAGSWFLGLRGVKESSPTIKHSDVRRSLLGSEGLPTLESNYPVEVKTSGEVQAESLEWVRTLNSAKGRTTHAGANKLKSLAEKAEGSFRDGEETDLPLLAYFGTGRLWLQKSSSTEIESLFPGSRLEGYNDCLNAVSNHQFLESWVQWRSSVILSSMSEPTRAIVGFVVTLFGGDGSHFLGDMNNSDTTTEEEATQNTEPFVVVRDAVQHCIPNCERFFFDFRRKELQLEMTSGETIPFSMLSDGYRNFVGMVADIAWRAVQLNPHYGAEAAEKVEGVVLIDELELHLHPSWQRQVLRDLCDTFPRLQFVVTTHSPQILASAKAEWVRVLEDGESTPTRVSHLYGKDSNTVLEDIMGATARPQEMQEKLDKIADLIEEEEWDEAERYLEGEIVPYLGEVDAEVVGIRTELALEKALADE